VRLHLNSFSSTSRDADWEPKGQGIQWEHWRNRCGISCPFCTCVLVAISCGRILRAEGNCNYCADKRMGCSRGFASAERLLPRMLRLKKTSYSSTLLAGPDGAFMECYKDSLFGWKVQGYGCGMIALTRNSSSQNGEPVGVLRRDGWRARDHQRPQRDRSNGSSPGQTSQTQLN
jgi:hypothetical protein